MAGAFRRDPRFEEREIDYKLRLAHGMAKARTALLSGAASWRADLIEALRSEDNNIIGWRLRDPLIDVIREADGASLAGFWTEQEPIPRRFAALYDFCDSPELRTPGAQLCIGSTLLMALGGDDNPPVRWNLFGKGLRLIGETPFDDSVPAFDSYQRGLKFLDEAVVASSDFGDPLRHRLEAQGVLWCVTGGWKEEPSGSRDLSGEEAEAFVDAEPGAPALTETQKRTVVLARLGQGLFRDRLIQMWGACAVTGCADTRLLRASHLKPWRASTNSERIDKFNGLLLTATLDAALDRGLITFEDDGRVMISPAFAKPDRDAAGIDDECQLEFVRTEHLPFLAYHRDHVFQAMTESERRRGRRSRTAHVR